MNRVQYTPSTAYIIFSIHWVQHSPGSASSQDYLSFLHSHDYKFTLECRFNFRHASIHDWPSSASSPWKLIGEVRFSHSHSRELTNWRIESQHQAPHLLTASKYLYKLARLQPPSSHPHGLHVHLQSRLIMVTKLTWLWPPSVSPTSLDYDLQVHLYTCLITISECISKSTVSRCPSISSNSLDYRLQVDLQTSSIMASDYISEFTRSSFSGTPCFPPKHCLQLIQIYRVHNGSDCVPI